MGGVSSVLVGVGGVGGVSSSTTTEGALQGV